MAPRSRPGAIRPGAAILALAVLSLLIVPVASAVPPRDPSQSSVSPGSKSKPAEPEPESGRSSSPALESDTQLTDPALAGTPAVARQLGASGQVDPLSGLGIRNPVCDRIAEIRDRETRLSCEANGTPESTYPASNYGFDVFIDTGIDAPTGTFAKGFVMILNGLWLGLIFVLKLVLSLLGLAFGLNPFADGTTMNRISAAIGRLYARVTDPWLSTTVVCGGIWFAYKGLIRREVAAGVGGTLAAVAMLVLGLWVVHQPGASVGQLATLSDQVALGVIGAPQAGSAARPSGSYAEAMSRLWSRLVEVPFAGLNFSDVGWALSRPPPEAVEKADQKFCDDVGALALLAALSSVGDEEARDACAQFAHRRYGEPRRVIDLYLRSSPGSPARKALWDFFDNDDAYKPKVAAQGGDGVLTRLSMLSLFAIGLLGAVLLLAWLAIRLFTQAAIAFVLLLAAPFALFFPLLGDSGRRAFKTWGLTLLGAVLAKVIYAAFLSVVLLGIAVLGTVNGPGGSATGFLLACAFSWSVFLKRAELVGWLSIGGAEAAEGRSIVGQVAGLAAARKVSRGATGSLRGVGRRGAEWTRERRADRGALTRQSASDSLQGSARALADQRYRDATRTVSAVESRRGPRPSQDAGARVTQSQPSLRALASGPAPSGGGGGGAARAPAAEPGRYERAKALLAKADRNQSRHGERWGEADLERFAKEDQELLRTSRDPADHAHRAGFDRAEFEALRGPDRERAEAAIEKARARDRQRLDVATEVPGRLAGRGRQAAEGLRQRREDEGPERRERLRRLRRERRAAEHRSSRRNLSRGA